MSLDRRIYRLSNKLSLVLPLWIQRAMNKNGAWAPPFRGSWGTEQYTHPDLLWTPQGWFLAATAYPYGSEIYESPEVFRRQPGQEWERSLFLGALAGPERRRFHYSDPDLFLQGTEVHLVYRRCSRDGSLRPSSRDELFARALGSGADSSKAIPILQGPHRSLLSPAVVPEAGGLLLLAVDASQPRHLLRRYRSPDGRSWTEDGLAELPGRQVWHLDLAVVQGRLLGTFLVIEEGTGFHTRLILGESRDGGLSFEELCDLEPGLPGVRRSYRSSICEGPEGPVLALGYETEGGAWGICLRQLLPAGRGFTLGGPA